ncbi:hypothetical protein [Streptomyces sp. NPDC101150]|uniref:hypothetical protein n=1 Tax=Streptomyces sp. NPDC101150 TaxID=3366114 RepID=UPI0038288487
MRTDRSSRAVRGGRWGAALLAVGILLAGQPAPSAVASDTPETSQSATPEAGGEFADIVRELLADPIGRAGYEAHRTLNMHDGNRNLAVIWFDVSDFQATHLESITRQFNENPSRSDYYIGYGKLLKREGNEALFDRIGIQGDGPLLEFAAVNDPRKDHSEAIIYDKFLYPILRSLGLGHKATLRLMNRAKAGFSDRGRCAECLKLTSAIEENNKGKDKSNFVSGTDYATKQEKAESANRVNALNSQARSVLNREEEQAGQQAKTALPVPGDTQTPCVSMGNSNKRPVMAMITPVAAGPCGDDDENAQSGALGQALSTNSGADAYGGVDFSTLEMRYISDGSDGVQYSYSSRPLPKGYQQDTALGMRMVKNLGADLRTWLALDPQKFWVNLNPTEPDRIVDSALGQTNAGRAMLEADLQMKRTSAKILHPDSATGKQYWRQLKSSADGSLCFSSRMWIVPGTVEVRQDGDALYILKAQLDVKTQSDHIDDPYAKPCNADPSTNAHNENLERTLVLPKVVKAVNTDPEYAPLRRAFMARIIAQWVRERHQQGHRTSFDTLIGSKDLGPAKMTGDWRPRKVFDDYVRSYRNKEFDIKRETTDGRYKRITRYVYGGADLTNVRLTGVSSADMRKRYPQLAQSARSSTGRRVTAADGSIWLGGSVPAPERGFWDDLKDQATRLTGGNGPLLVVILLALAAILFGFRNRPHRGNRPAA